MYPGHVLRHSLFFKKDKIINEVAKQLINHKLSSVETTFLLRGAFVGAPSNVC